MIIARFDALFWRDVKRFSIKDVFNVSMAPPSFVTDCSARPALTLL